MSSLYVEFFKVGHGMQKNKSNEHQEIHLYNPVEQNEIYMNFVHKLMDINVFVQGYKNSIANAQE